jgi:glycosyltransferase involved in cell wall biosynthesis
MSSFDNTAVGLMEPPPSVAPSHESRRICIVTSATVCCNPRVVKEADALSAAGYDVRVVASQQVGWAAEWDAELMVGRKWKLDSVRWDDSERQARRIRLTSGIRQQGFGLLAKATKGWGTAERAYSRLFTEQLKKAILERADLYVAHNPQALPVAAAAAEHYGVDFAFDSEDFHSGEFSGAQRNSDQFRLLGYLESKYLPGCLYVTTPSEPIADALVKRYGIARPTTIQNVFSWSDRTTLDGEIKDRQGDALSLYWYSQIIGLDRGLQDVIRAASLLSGPVQIHLRGELTESVRAKLMGLAKECAVAHRIFFHPPVSPTELLSRAAEHDVGLALEQQVSENRNLTVTNKVFFFLLAGLALAASDTVGQRKIVSACPGAGFLYSPGDHKSLAAGLQALIDSPDLLLRRKAAALQAAQQRWNWETESRQLLELVGSALTQTSAVRR